MTQIDSQHHTINGTNGNGHTYMNGTMNGKQSSASTAALAAESPIDDNLFQPNDIDEANYIREAYETQKLALPVIATYALEVLPPSISLIFVGHLNDQFALDVAALATMFTAVTGLSIGLGMATALDTLASQASGAGQPHLIGTYVQRGVILLAIACVPIFIINWNADSLLIWAGQPADIATAAGIYCRVACIGLPFNFVYELATRALQAQSLVRPNVVVNIISNLLNAALCWLLIYEWELSWLGAAIARSLSVAISPFLLIGYVYAIGFTKRFWFGWSRACLREWMPFLQLSLPGTFQMCSEWWAFEFMALFAGLADATAVRVGSFTGAGQPVSARTAARVGITSGFGISCVWAIALWQSRDWLPLIFTAESTVNSMVTGTMFPLVIFQLPYSINAVAGGAFRGLGQQRRGGIINTFSFYVIGLPIGYWLAFSYNWSLYGLWSGLIVGLLAACILSLSSVMMADWSHHVDVAAQRLAVDHANEAAAVAAADIAASISQSMPHESDPLLPFHISKSS